IPTTGSGSVEECSAFNVSRNFLFLAPEVMKELAKDPTFVSKVSAAVDEYDRVVPYWFVAGFDDTINEAIHQPTYDRILLQVKGYILGESRTQLLRYLDAPGFRVGDLMYLQNLSAVIEAAP